MSVANIQDELERLLRKATVDELVQVTLAMEIEVPDEAIEERKRRKLLRNIEDALDNKKDDANVMLLYEQLYLPPRLNEQFQEVLVTMSKSNEKSDESLVKDADSDITQAENEAVSRQSDLENQYDKLKKLQAQQDQLFQMQKKILEDKEDELDTKFQREFRRDSNSSAAEAIKLLGLKRELKIQGTIGGKGESRLSYASLHSQVQEAKTKKYTEDEICFALRRAVSAGSELRTYLDALDTEITLEETLRYIRGMYKEKTACEIFSDLNKISQTEGEENQVFLFRTLGLKQKMITASKLENEIGYSRELINTIFKRAVFSGLRDKTVREHMKPFLKPESTASDRELIEEINKVSMEETEWNSKQGAKATVSEVSVPKDRKVRFQEVSVEAQVQSALSPLMETIKQMSLQMAEMQKELTEMRVKQCVQPNNNYKTWKLRCTKCREQNVGCEHCVKCGKEGHRAAQCTSPSSSSN